MIKFYVYLKMPSEKTGDWCTANNADEAVELFAKKKQITVLQWLKIYTIKEA